MAIPIDLICKRWRSGTQVHHYCKRFIPAPFQLRRHLHARSDTAVVEDLAVEAKEVAVLRNRATLDGMGEVMAEVRTDRLGVLGGTEGVCTIRFPRVLTRVQVGQYHRYSPLKNGRRHQASRSFSTR